MRYFAAGVARESRGERLGCASCMVFYVKSCSRAVAVGDRRRFAGSCLVFFEKQSSLRAKVRSRSGWQRAAGGLQR